jgi:hypothetical protein
VTTLKQALKTLDPANDEHWTSGGLPRMETLEALVGKELTRADVEEAAPDLKRSNAPEPKAAADTDNDPAPQPPNAPPVDNDHAAEGAVQLRVGTGGGGSGGLSGDFLGGGGGPADAGVGRDIGAGVKVGSIEGRVAALEADLAYLRKQFGWPTRSA